MARKGPASQGRRVILWLGALIVVLVLLLGGGAMFGGASWAPKLALDLEGGTQMILAPKVEGGATITDEQMQQAVSIIRQRVDGSGVSESQINTQSGNNVVVSMPGTPTSEQRDLIKASAAMSFRPVITSAAGTATPKAQLTPEAQIPKPTAAPTNASDPNNVTPDIYKLFESYSCVPPVSNPIENADPKKATVACEPGTGQKYILGPVEVLGKDISSASYGLQQTAQGGSTNKWAVNLEFNGEGTTAFRNVTTRLNGYYLTNQSDPKAQFAIVLDGQVISAPSSQAVITDGKSQITGSFTEASAKSLSDKLKFGALPISFTIQSEQQVSATLGTQQLEMGLLAGAIGLLLVVIYSLFQYRMLGLVTVASLVVAGVLTYLAIALLGWGMGYRLSLAGVAGLIVAIGQTADSFIVYFERIRDELREGRSLATAVANGWQRAKRTVLASKAVNLLAAVVLYFVAVGNVQGFAFTLGLTAIADLIVVFMFTHPMLQMLSTRKFFSEGHRFSGLSPDRLGAIPMYRGAGRLRTPEDRPSVAKGTLKAKNAGAAAEAERRQTIAERKLVEKLASGDKAAGSAAAEGKDSASKTSVSAAKDND
ncbi:preprotein translocase subunit SecD [Psychromicrobium silvestre]|uniref:Protein translocase subunit SecD n=1 Tax=Psychromicrobium silvestre TaxID=1645614 RepID=A0A7Y9S4B1_9MICC|nr:protein translocase subunit SecD [Psychromicrobium silvestre]NYE94309.1 preprotein translocase subunit SecD [Psychromicrobium silvestre]